MTAACRWDIFCKVIDNYGDIGVCWRLARQLANAQGLQVRLWVDDLTSFKRLVPELDVGLTVQSCRDIEIRHWAEDFPAISADEIPDVVIEAFACRLPNVYEQAMSKRAETGRPAPVWINLEYLSAEAWVDSHHGLASPHPQLPLTKYFFFPGFTTQTGGLLAEQGLHERRAEFQASQAAQNTFWHSLGLAPPQDDEQRISMFAYPAASSAFKALMDHWSTDAQLRTVLIPQRVLHTEVAQFFGAEPQPGKSLQRGSLSAHVFPFLDQDNYDRLLWACDLNFVRGEDSFVRAQWAAKPFVWQIYPQEEEAHWTKLNAFLNRIAQAWPDDISAAQHAFWCDWNQAGTGSVSSHHWLAFERSLPLIQACANDWIDQISAGGDLVTRLMQFVEAKSLSRSPFG